jgi:hypothetical protein
MQISSIANYTSDFEANSVGGFISTEVPLIIQYHGSELATTVQQQNVSKVLT